MRRILIGVAACMAACTPQDRTAAPDETPISAATLARFAGTWRMREFSEAGDSVGWFDLLATADTSGWRTIVPDRPPIARRVVAARGDSVVNEIGPFESVLRPGVMVVTRETFRRVGEDELIGTIVARYTAAGPDSILRIRTAGKRITGAKRP